MKINKCSGLVKYRQIVKDTESDRGAEESGTQRGPEGKTIKVRNIIVKLKLKLNKVTIVKLEQDRLKVWKKIVE